MEEEEEEGKAIRLMEFRFRAVGGGRERGGYFLRSKIIRYINIKKAKATRPIWHLLVNGGLV